METATRESLRALVTESMKTMVLNIPLSDCCLKKYYVTSQSSRAQNLLSYKMYKVRIYDILYGFVMSKAYTALYLIIIFNEVCDLWFIFHIIFLGNGEFI